MDRGCIIMVMVRYVIISEECLKFMGDDWDENESLHNDSNNDKGRCRHG